MVNDGNHAPLCTAEAIKDHLWELASAKNGQFVVSVEFDKPCDDTTKELYNKWRKDVKREKDSNTGKLLYENIHI